MGLFALDFMVRALVAGVLTGLMAPAIGTFIVQRKLSLLGDGLGHVAIAGVGLALWTGSTPIPVAIVICVLGAVVIELLRGSGRASGDVGLAILFYGGLAAGVLMAGLAGRGGASLSQYLFGSLTSVSRADLWLVAVLALVVLILVIGLAPQMFAVSVDEDYARTRGLPVRIINVVIMLIAALTVALSMRTVGVMLVSALMVVPVSTATNIVVGFFRCLWTAMGIGAVVCAAGVVGSYYLDSPSGATIVIFAILVFIVSLSLRPLLDRWRRAKIDLAQEDTNPVFPCVDEHESTKEIHTHKAILHGDHVDYLDEGHRHPPNGDQFDEH